MGKTTTYKQQTGLVGMTYIQLQNNSQTVIGQRYWCTDCNYEQGYGHMFGFWKIPTAEDIGYNLGR